jgi:c-di-GMP-binding flagellar brake protein YcgR
MSAILARKVHRRAFRREVLLWCQVVRERDFKLVSSLAFDLSTDGMHVLSGDRVLTGEPLIVSFRSPNGRGWFDLEATVARVIHGRRPGDRGRGLGLEFQRIDEADQARLFDGLRGLPPPQTYRPQEQIVLS